MKFTQVKDIANQFFKMKLGEEAVLNADCSNINDLGTRVANIESMNKVTEEMMDLVAKIVWKSDTYRGKFSSIVRDSVEYGSIVAKYSVDDIPEFIDNEAYQLQDGASYDENLYYGVKVTSLFYNKSSTFVAPLSIKRYQLNSVFRNMNDFHSYANMLETAVINSLTSVMESFTASTLNTAIAAAAHANVPDGKYGNHSGTEEGGLQLVNLLKQYNDEHPDNKLTVKEALKNQDALRDTAYNFLKVLDRIGNKTVLYNAGHKKRFINPEDLRIFMLSDYANAAKVYLYSDVYNNEFVKLPNAEVISYWQGPGKTFDFNDVSKINVTYEDENGSPVTVEMSGIVAVAMHKDAAWVVDEDRITESKRNIVGDFTNFWHKITYRGAVDINEPLVVFYLAEEEQ